MYANALVSTTWIADSLRAVRNVLQAEGRDELALAISEAIGGLSATTIVPGNRRIDDGLDDFEDLDPESSDPEWPVWTDRETWTLADEPDAAGPTPLDLLAAGVPVSGGSPDFEPSVQDWADYGEWATGVDLADREAWMTFNDHVEDIAQGSEIASGGLTDADIARSTGCAG